MTLKNGKNYLKIPNFPNFFMVNSNLCKMFRTIETSLIWGFSLGRNTSGGQTRPAAQDNGTGHAMVGRRVRRGVHKGRITGYNRSLKTYLVKNHHKALDPFYQHLVDINLITSNYNIESNPTTNIQLQYYSLYLHFRVGRRKRMIESKVDVPNTITYLNWTPTFEWYVVRCGSRTCG